MEVHAVRRRHWGIFAWATAFGALAFGGVPDAMMRHWMHKVTEPGPRSATDSMIYRTVGIHDGTKKLRELLANTAPPKPGRTYVVRIKWEDQYEEVAIAISLLAWPDEVKFVTFEKGEFVPQVPAPGSPERVFYLGKRPREDVPGLQQFGEQAWFKPGGSPP